MMPEHVRWLVRPQLRDPLLVLAFEGWNDAGESASTAARYLAAQTGAAPLVDVKLDLEPLAASARECEQRMSQMVSADPELAEYVRELKRREFAQ